jgi:hypothetical protein
MRYAITVALTVAACTGPGSASAAPVPGAGVAPQKRVVGVVEAVEEANVRIRTDDAGVIEVGRGELTRALGSPARVGERVTLKYRLKLEEAQREGSPGERPGQLAPPAAPLPAPSQEILDDRAFFNARAGNVRGGQLALAFGLHNVPSDEPNSSSGRNRK